jgi:hypothetical protein
MRGDTKMKARKTGLVMALWLAGLLVAAAPSQADLLWYTWNNNGDGAWYDATKWTPPPAYPPGYPNGTAFGAHITGSEVIVSLFQDSPEIRIGGLEVDAGDTLALIPISGIRLWFDNGTNNPTVINNGSINLTVTPDKDCYLTSTGTVTFTGTGEIVLGNYPRKYILVDNYINDTDHTIRGGGRISAPGVTALNKGKIIADNGMLMINTAVNNQGILGANGPGNYLQIYNTTCTGGLYNPGDGLIQLWTVTLNDPTFGPGTVTTMEHASFLNGNSFLDPGTNLLVDNGGQLHFGGSAVVTNHGTIQVNAGVNTAVIYAVGTVTLTGPGSVVLNGNLYSQLWTGPYDSFINDTPHTIQGGGIISAITNNKGQIIANNGELRINQPVTGTGSVSVTDGATLFLYGNNLQCGNLTLSRLATLKLQNERTIDLKGNFSFAMTDPASWIWMYQNALQMSGGGATKQSLEVGGKDYGADGAGFSNNFNPQFLGLAGAGTYVYLADAVNNGQWPAREAIYVGGDGHLNTTLNVPPGTTLNLNNTKLYAYLNNNIRQVKAGEGSLFGGGQIINAAIAPGPRSVPGIISPLLLN